MSLGAFKVCKDLTKLLKIPADCKKFKINLTKAFEGFYENKVQTSHTVEIVSQVKKL